MLKVDLIYMKNTSNDFNRMLQKSSYHFRADRVDFSKFRKVLMRWMKEQGKYHDSDFSGGKGSGFFFAYDGGNGIGDTDGHSDFNAGRDVF